MGQADSYYPKSFLKLLLVAVGLVSLPLVLAMAGAALYVETVAAQSRGAVVQAAQAVRGSRLLMENVTGLERVARQFLILSDRRLIEDYAQLRASFKAITSQLSLLPLDESQLGALNSTIDREQQLFEKLSPAPRIADRPTLIEGYAGLAADAGGVLAISNALIDREIANLTGSAESARQHLLVLMVAALVLGVLLAMALSFHVARLVGQIERAVLRLGAGEFAQPVSFSGPADFEYLGARLDWLRRRLAALEQDRERFLRHASHELKTPLTSLREGAELLADGSLGTLTSEQQEVAAILQSRGRHLQTLIERLLEYQRASHAMRQMLWSPVALHEVVANVIENHRLAAAAREVTLEPRLESARVMGDAKQLRVVADNLLSNAVKYAAQGGSVRIQLQREGDAVVLEVQDNGAGVAVADRERIFDWFFQGEGKHGGRVPGTGLGLAITREAVVAHRGLIELASPGGPGACFRVSLPVA